ncbi:glycosyltransferase family 39 protein [Moniliophthora roreri MCA 2997]|uniref:Dolichyl-phosphate-mannose--protein mannosyltransferase n=2 Tax=Moniliophthora roreri TaxID=221103 RepID=V2WLU2_MONRO|nr:glycosyltransferase family 39 protein [Moniliophthora roreri MCA 2997]KAI3603598.1 glycosyltransferase family 39 protein [Moniliophthora roreri]
MAGNVRARRPASPPPGVGHTPPSLTSQRFPHPRQDHLDADARREAASKGYVPGRTKSSFSYPSGGLNLTSGEIKLLVVIVIIASAVRLFRLSRPNSVVFDEVHFGKFASKYIKTQYFMDVHPPLAKLLITLAGFVFGYDGHFDFKDIGKIYDGVPYVGMRMVPATLGVATVPLAYLTLRALDCRATTALLASLFITFENGLVTQSRHILLDSPLIFFTALSIFSWVGFCNEDKHRPFTESWWIWLILSGLSLGAVVSCKWVGLFTIATVGVSTVYQLWLLLGDLRVPPRLFIKHFAARALCLIVIPIIFYMAMFQIHFLILENSGDGDGFMSSEFQHTLGGRGMKDTFADVAIGSEVSIRHVNTQGGYLHSHSSTYPGGSKQQQITLYPHRDHNNDWRIINATNGDPSAIDFANTPLEWITPGMRIRLRHIATEKNLHSHDVRPPVSDVDFQNEVSGYGFPGFEGDGNDDWFVEIDHGDKRDRESHKRLRTLRTKFRLRHALTGCYLFSHKVKLPEWGFEQQEVTCNKNAVRANSLWMIETAMHPGLPADAPKVNYRLPGFLAKFLELQQVMWTTNAGLTDRHTFDSRPDAWPRLRRGINFWVKDHRQIYLIGNLWVWWLSTAAVFAYAAVRGLLILRAKRGYKDFNNTTVVKYDGLCGFLCIGWALHYFPFFLMSRQLFLHHYFPALYFAILLSCGVFDFLTSTLRPKVRLQIAAVLIVIAIWNFQHFAPLAYGTPWTKAKCNSAKWLKNWDFSCNDFLDDYSQYTGLAAATPQKSANPVATVGNGRAEIVVEDVAQKKANEKAEEEHTSVFVNKPEPGRDIFAQQPVKDIKSDAVVAAQKAQEQVEEKIISTFAPAPPQQDGKEDEKVIKVEEKKTEEKVEDNEKEKAKAPVEDKKQTSATSEDDDIEGVDPIHEPAKKVAGPKEEADIVAEKVAQELYPSAD